MTTEGDKAGKEAAEEDECFATDASLIGRMCMELIDIDRSLAAVEQGYTARLLLMQPPSCSPKNHIICGHPAMTSSSPPAQLA